MAVPPLQAKTERLLNLVLVLLYTRRPLEKSEIRNLVPQYAALESTTAFDRTFERDKDELRGLGVPLAVEETDLFFEHDVGYRIHQRDYALPDIEFAPDELAVLGLAQRSWAHASMAGPAAQALRKLRALGVERAEDALIGIEPRLRAIEPTFDAVKDAVIRRVPVQFSYRRPEVDEPTVRRVQPWSLAQWHGRWYLTGFDLDREASRVFRLSRIEGEVGAAGPPDSFTVPADHEPYVTLSRAVPTAKVRTATVAVAAGTAHSLHRRGQQVDDLSQDSSPTNTLAIDFDDLEAFGSELAGHGEQVRVLEPDDLRVEVQRRLGEVAALHQGMS